MSMSIALFRLGKIVTTPKALERLTQQDILNGIKRHQAGDWGEVDEYDRQMNHRALAQGGCLCSVFCSANGIAFWLITEANRSLTHVLLDEERRFGLAEGKTIPTRLQREPSDSIHEGTNPPAVPSREVSKERKLKIEATGDFAAGKVKPQIRLKGLWLADAGFQPGKNVQVSVLKEGLLKLEVYEEVPEP